MVPALALMYVKEDVDALLLLNVALEHAGGAALDELVVDDVVWDSESKDNLFDELNRGGRFQLLYWLGLDPLGELVHCHQQVRHAASSGFEGSHHVESPDREGPGDWNGPEC